MDVMKGLEETCRSTALTGDADDGLGEVRGFWRVHVAGNRCGRHGWWGLGMRSMEWKRRMGWLVLAVCGKQTLEVTDSDH